MLPTNWLGAAVLVAAVGLVALQLRAGIHGAPGLAAAAGLIVGCALLFSQPESVLPIQIDVAVAAGVVIGMAATGLMGGLLLARIVRRVRTLPSALSLEQLIGARGASRSELDLEGVVCVGGQLWSARVRGEPREADRPVQVVARQAWYW